jgi:hypothetical protein
MFWMRAYTLSGEVGGGWNSRVFWALWNGNEPIGEFHFLQPSLQREVVIKNKKHFYGCQQSVK